MWIFILIFLLIVFMILFLFYLSYKSYDVKKPINNNISSNENYGDSGHNPTYWWNVSGGYDIGTSDDGGDVGDSGGDGCGD